MKKHVVKALFTALNSREIASEIGMESSEEPFICGMLNHLGRLIVSFYFPKVQNAIEKLIEEEEISEEDASRRIMRLSYTELSQSIAGSWNLPELLRNGLTPIAPLHKGTLRGKEETLQGVTAYASELSEIAMLTNSKKRSVALGNLLRKYQGKINLTPEDLEGILVTSLKNAAELSNTIKISLRALGLKLDTEERSGEKTDAYAAINTWETKALSDDDKEITLMLQANASHPDSLTQTDTNAAPPESPDSLLDNSDYLMERQEISISDTSRVNNEKLMPGHIFKILDPKSLVMIPLTVKKAAIGLFVVTRSLEQPAIGDMDLHNMRMLVNQCIIAIRQFSR